MNIKNKKIIDCPYIEIMHGFDFDDAVILMKIDNTYKRLVAEKCFIKTYSS